MRAVIISVLMLAACSEAEMPEVDQELQERRSARVEAMAAAYDGSIRYKDTFNALDPLIKRSAIARGSKFDPNDDYWGLPRTEGYEEVAAYCASCHSLAIVMQQRVTPERWDYLLDWMVEKQNMPELEAEERALIHRYLIEHFSSNKE
ncbi:hypothetical protein KFE96_08145 [Kordiimonas sp. SCSIO 12603]|uniref:hypothetical protein n=1 Tax=Kordiimonas sp. SCSIO 12603 TaxID=2829596 RepID=UPI0021074117|nr:hypothetical protein [Kordiimonas sp. SCSIO 12603]UTW60272.1 hypothetical protein KFE96_08145 [Kordiimonas sp. SCSIO 12603]